jgi:hypothetical protein
MITAVLIAGILVSGIADAAALCCGRMPGPGIASSDPTPVACDTQCHDAPPPCRARQAAPAEVPKVRGAEGGARETCCKSDRHDTLMPTGFLRSPSPSTPLALDKPVGTHDAAGLGSGEAAPETRRAIPLTTPIYLLKNAILC